jgi:RNA polymerase sigma factor (sigma-70 family)
MTTNAYRIFLVDDDPSVRDALGLLLGLNGYSVSPFRDAESFLQSCRPDWQGCALIDIRMPGMDGLTLQERLREAGCEIPVVLITGHGDVESARRAFRAQAVDFLEKPLDHGRLLSAIKEAFEGQAAKQDAADQRARFDQRRAILTPREREIMELVVAGQHNRDIAQSLNISPRTVEVHKARMLAKLEVQNLPDLVRLCMAATSGPSAPN